MNESYIEGGPEPKRLVITGSRLGRPDVPKALNHWVDLYGEPALVIVGDQQGVDMQALTWARTNKYDYHRERVTPNQPWPDCFHERNQRMVSKARPGDFLLAFPTRGSTGTWDCFRRGQKAELVCIDVTPTFYELRRAQP